MFEQLIIYSIWFAGLGLLSAGALALLDRTFSRAMLLFIVSNLAAAAAGVAYFLGDFGKTLAIMHSDLFFHFNPQITPLSAVFFLLSGTVAALVGIYSLRYLDLYKEEYNPKTVVSLMSFFVLGMQGVLLSANTFSFLFFWELMSVASFFLVFSDKSQASIKAAFLYFVMTHLGASAILGGFLILGHGSFFFDLNDIASASQSLSPFFRVMAFALFLFGFGSKAGLVPFHVWLPEAHPQAPSNVSALMSGLMLKIAVYGFMLVTLKFSMIPSWFGLITLSLGLLSGFAGALNAAVKRDIKTCFAYSSIENMGIIFIMMGLAIYFFGKNDIFSYGLIAFAIIHAISHALFKTALFLGSGVIINRAHEKSLDKLGGIAKAMPVFAGAFLLAILSSLPLPPFGTFYGEWGLVQSLIHLMKQSFSTTNSAVMLLVVLSGIGLIGGLAIFAMIRIFSASMLGLPRNSHLERRAEGSDKLMIAPILLLGMTVLFVGIFASSLFNALMAEIKNFAYGENLPMSVAVNINSVAIAALILLIFVSVYLAAKLFGGKAKEREYNTWDCGQPIDSTMEYTATAFAAPIRFFFLPFVGMDKKLESVPVTEGNPWIRKYKLDLRIRSVWSDHLYEPIAKALYFVAEKIKFVQGGRIQFYILFLLFSLIITLIFAL